MGTRMINVPNSAPLEVFSFVRQNERDKVFAVLNFSVNDKGSHFRSVSIAGNISIIFRRAAG